MDNLCLYFLKRFKENYTLSIWKHLLSLWFVFRKNCAYI